MTTGAVLAETAQGRVEGGWNDGVAVFRALPFAARRSAPGASGRRSQRSHGAACARPRRRFVLSGDPHGASLPPWPPYRFNRRWTLRVDRVTETVSDLAGVTLPGRPWPATVPLPGQSGGAP